MTAVERIAERIHVDVVPVEARGLQGRRAGLISRGIANVVDFCVVLGIVGGLYVGWTFVRFLWQGRSFTFPSPGFAAAVAIGTGVQILYFTASWVSSGRTYGDRLMGLRVVGRSGERLHLGWGLVRATLCALFPFGLLWAGMSAENRSVQDLILRTSVLYDWTVRPRSAGRDSDDALGVGVEVAATVPDEADDGHAEPLPRLDGER